MQISVSKAGPYGSATAKNGPTGSAYVTYRGNEDARRCIEAVHGTEWEGPCPLEQFVVFRAIALKMLG